MTVVERLKAADLKIFDGMVPSWQLFAPMLDEGMQSTEEVGTFASRHLRSKALRQAIAAG